MKIRINKIVRNSLVDGPGERLAIFLQGCALACKGCQNRALWDSKGGYETTVEDLVQVVENLGSDQVTITGGEPLLQAEAAITLGLQLKNAGKHVILYTGYEIESLPVFGYHWILPRAFDVIVDGPFIKELDHDKLTYRGSANQRPVDVKATWETGHVVTLEWDNELVIAPNGDLVMPLGFADELDLGQAENSRMCGQTRGY